MACPRPSSSATPPDWSVTSTSARAQQPRAQLNDYLVRQAGPDVASSPFGAPALWAGRPAWRCRSGDHGDPDRDRRDAQGHVWKRGRNELQGGDAFGATEPARPLKHAEHHFEALDRFVIDVDRGPGQPPLKVAGAAGPALKVVDLRWECRAALDRTR